MFATISFDRCISIKRIDQRIAQSYTDFSFSGEVLNGDHHDG
jgi:hypothetical protein